MWANDQRKMKNTKTENKNMLKVFLDIKNVNFPSLVKVIEKGKYKYVMAFGIIPLISIKTCSKLK